MKTRKRKTARRHTTCIRKPRRQKAHIVSIWPSGFIKEQNRRAVPIDVLCAKWNMKRTVFIFYNCESCVNYEPIDLTAEQKSRLIRQEKLFAKMAREMGPDRERRRMRDIEAVLGTAVSPFAFEALYGQGGVH